MTISVTQGSNSVTTVNGTSTASFTKTITPTVAGSMLYMLLGSAGSASAPLISSVSDSVDGSWVVKTIGPSSGTSGTASAGCIAYKLNTSSTAARTVTVTFASTTTEYYSVQLGEATGVGGFDQLATTVLAAGNASITVPSTGTVTPAQAGSLLLGVATDEAGTPWAAPTSPWTVGMSVNTSGSGIDVCGRYQVQSGGPTAFSVTFTDTNGHGLFPVAGVAIFYPASGSDTGGETTIDTGLFGPDDVDSPEDTGEDTSVFEYVGDAFTPQRASNLIPTPSEDSDWVPVLEDDEHLQDEPFDWVQPATGPPNELPYPTEDADDKTVLDDEEQILDEDFGWVDSQAVQALPTGIAAQYDASIEDEQDEDDRLDKEAFDIEIHPVGPDNSVPAPWHDASLEPDHLDDEDEPHGYELSTVVADNANPPPPQDSSQDPDPLEDDDEPFGTELSPAAPSNYGALGQYDASGEEEEPEDEAFGLELAPLSPDFVQPNLPIAECGDQADEDGQIDDEDFGVCQGTPVPSNEIPYPSDDASVLAALGDDEESGDAEVSLDTQSQPLSPDNAAGGMSDASADPDPLDDDDESFDLYSGPVGPDNLLGGAWDASQEPDGLEDEDEPHGFEGAPLSADFVPATNPYPYDDGSTQPDALEDEDEAFDIVDGQNVLGGTSGPGLGVSFEDASQQLQDEEELDDEDFAVDDSQVVYTDAAPAPSPAPAPVNPWVYQEGGGGPAWGIEDRRRRQRQQDDRDIEDILRLISGNV